MRCPVPSYDGNPRSTSSSSGERSGKAHRDGKQRRRWRMEEVELVKVEMSLTQPGAGDVS